MNNRSQDDGLTGQEEEDGRGRRGRRGEAQDRDLRRHTALRGRGRTLPVVPLRDPTALHLRLRLPVLRTVLHNPHTRAVLVQGARAHSG